jgi:RNA polymerase sigma-70 factor (ECF subfamily)
MNNKDGKDGASDANEEQDAIAALKRGDAHGLDALARLHQLRAVRTAYLILGDRPAAEDVVADAFVTAFNRAHQFDPRRPFGPWFYRIVVNGALMWLRWAKRHASLDEADDWPDHSPQPDDLASEVETRDAILAAMHALSPEQRAVVVLRFYLDMDERDVAHTLRMPLGTVKWRMHAAKRALRRALSEPRAQALLTGRWET